MATNEDARLENLQRWVLGIRRDAQEAWDEGRTWHQVVINAHSTRQDEVVGDPPGALQAIEEVGWRLHDVGYMPSTQGGGQRFRIGDSAGYSLVAIYLFRRPDSPLPRGENS